MLPKIFRIDYFGLVADHMDKVQLLVPPAVEVTDNQTQAIQHLVLPKHRIDGSAESILKQIADVWAATLAVAELLPEHAELTEENLARIAERTVELKATLRDQI